MKNTTQTSFIGIILAIALGTGLAIAGSQSSAAVSGIPIFALMIGIAFAIQWLVFIIAYVLKSEKFFDLTGSLTYITVMTSAILLSPSADNRSLVLLVLVLMWATRLGTFLFNRVIQQGKDDRFDEIKVSLTRFLLTWTLQGVWVSFTAAAALAAITTEVKREFGWVAWVGVLIWVIGYMIELVADAQKNRFKADPANQGKFIREGLWAWSRHPNYFGEIMIWIGVALIALPVLNGWALITLISPLWVILQLTVISGIPMLEKKADKQWGGQEAYESYKQNTPVLIPRPPSREP